MTFGPLLVSTMGIALPVLAAIWLMPRGESLAVATSPQPERSPSLLLRRWRRYLEWVGTAVHQWHLPGSIGPSSTVRHG
jgi:hypothetical protein